MTTACIKYHYKTFEIVNDTVYINKNLWPKKDVDNVIFVCPTLDKDY